MATKKDFIPAAAALKAVKRWSAHDQFVWMECCRAIAGSFADGNHRFDSHTFLEACGFYDEFVATTVMVPVEAA